MILWGSKGIYAEDFVRVATEIWPPYNYEESGVLTGTSTQIVQSVLKRAKIPYEIDVFPWARAYLIAQNDKNVLIYTIMRIPEREELFKWVRPLEKSDTVSLYRAVERDDIEIITLDDAKKYRTVVVRDDMNHKFLSSHGFQEDIHLHLITEQKQSIDMVLLKRADLLLFSGTNLIPELRSFGVSEKRIKKIIPLFKTTPYMAFSKQTQDELVERVGKAYDELVSDGKIKKYE